MMEDSPTTRALLDSVSDGVIRVDGSRRVSFMNLEAQRLTGRNLSRAAGRDLWEVCPLVERATRRTVTDGIEVLLSSNGRFDLPGATVLVPVEGNDVLVSGSVFPSCGTGAGPGSIEWVVFRDVSARWLLDRSLRNSQSVDAMRVLTRGIAGNVSDILTVLLARLTGISREHGDRGAVLRHVRESRKLIGRISGMISSLASDPGSPPESDLCLVSRVVGACARRFSAAYPDTELSLACPDRTGFAALSGGLLEQVLMNLLMNAGQAVGAGGGVVLTAVAARLPDDVPPFPRGDHILFTVSDNGPGISGDDMTRIFNPFFSTGRNRYGLGLPAVYSIVNGCGGYVTVDSETGRGSCFTVTLPAARGIENETAEDVIPSVTVTGLDDGVSDEVIPILESIGCDVVRGGTEDPGAHGENGDQLPSSRLVLTDYDHFMSGRETLRVAGSSVDGFIVLVDGSIRSTADMGPGVRFLDVPVKLDRLVSAVALMTWSGSGKVRGDDQDEG